MDMEFTFSNVRNIIILEVKNPLRMLNYGTSVTGDEEFDRLRKAILGHESPRLSPEQLLTLGGGRGRKKIGIRNGDGRGTGVVNLASQFLGTLGFGIMEFDVNEIHLELLLRLNADKKRRTPSSRNDLL
jgi:hypothetical protein